MAGVLNNVMLRVYDTDGNTCILDLFENESPKLNYEFASLLNFEARSTFSQSFRLAWTKNNAEFFGPINVVGGGLTWFDFRKKVKADILVNTLLISRGHIKVERIINRANNTYEIEVTFFGEVPDITKALGDKKIADLDHAELVHDVDQSTVVNHGDYLWSVCDRGNKWSELGEAGTRRIYDESNPVRPSELTPAINALWIWKRIFTEAGYTYQSSIVDDVLREYYVPYLNSESINGTNSLASLLFVGGFEDGYSFTLSALNQNQLLPLEELQDNGGNFTPGSLAHFTAPYSGEFTFRVSVRAKINNTGTTPSPSFSMRVTKTNDVNDVWPLAGGTMNGFFLSNNYADITRDIRVYMEDGDEMYVWLRASNGFAWSIDIDRWNVLELTAAGEVFSGFTFRPELNAPDMKQIDFVRSIMKAHCLVMIPDKNDDKRFVYEPIQTWIGSGEVRDWSGKIVTKGPDGGKDIVIQPTTNLQNKQTLWTYKAGGEELSKLFVSAGRTYGEYKIDTTDNDFAISTSKNELQFSSTPCNEIGGTDIPIPKFIDASGKFVSPGPRLLFRGGTAQVMLYTDSGPQPVEVSVLSHYSSFNPSIGDLDLNFAPETPLQYITGNPYGNLFNLYWRRYYEELYSSESMIMECYVNLNLTDVYSFSFADRIFIRGHYWRILEINSYAVGEDIPTKVKLAKIVNPSPACSIKPSGRRSDGTVIWKNSANEVVGGNEFCCKLYGYEWTDGDCYSFMRPIR